MNGANTVKFIPKELYENNIWNKNGFHILLNIYYVFVYIIMYELKVASRLTSIIAYTEAARSYCTTSNGRWIAKKAKAKGSLPIQNNLI